MDKKNNSTSVVETIIGYIFQDKELLLRALTHASLEGPNYERLEFLGDRVLGVIVAEMLFKKHPEEKEGALAKRFSALVRGQTLAAIGKEIDIAQYILFSETDTAFPQGTENDNIIADVMESLLGAMYLDGGLTPCKAMIEKYWDERFETMTKPPQDPKTELQEWAQGLGKPTPSYEIIAREGLDHAPIFTIEVKVEGMQSQTAKASNRRQAEKDAARKVLKSL